jgi:hypothetical protein
LHQPIVIRAHHMDRFFRVGRFARSGDEHDDPTYRAANAASVITKDFKSASPRERWYAADTVGLPERQEEYKALTEAVYRRFQTAPPGYPIIVVTAEPDDICNLCAVGNHCHMRNAYGNGKDSLRYWEDNYFNCFRDAYEYLYEWGHVPTKPHIVEVTIRFIDSYYPVKARRFYTDKESFQGAAGVADHYLKKYFDFLIY